MPDIGRTLDALDSTAVGVLLGAGLTYSTSLLNRRHQEKREDKTRWYNSKLEAYSTFLSTVFHQLFIHTRTTLTAEEPDSERRRLLTDEYMQVAVALQNATAPIRIVGSTEIIKAVEGVLVQTLDLHEGRKDENRWNAALNAFAEAARTDLGRFD
jgi:hypothetical protein